MAEEQKESVADSPADSDHSSRANTEGMDDKSPQENGSESVPPKKEDAREVPSTANTAGDNRGQFVQAAVLYGGVHNYYSSPEGFSFGAETARQVRETRRVDPQRVRSVCATFVEPAGYQRFRSELEELGVGVITGRPESGRGVTAIRVLESSGFEIQEVTPEPHDRQWSPTRLPAEPGHAYLMDISPLGGALDEYHGRVREYAARIRGKGGRLVVVARSSQWEEDPTDAFAHFALRAPEADRVFARHLAHATSEEEAERWLRDPGVLELLNGARLAYATRFAAKAARMRPAEPALSDEEFAEWVGSVLRVFKDWGQEVKRWFAELEKKDARVEHENYDGSGRTRSTEETVSHGDYLKVLIEAVAVLEGCPSDALMLKADELAQDWGIIPPSRSPVSGSGLTEVLAYLGAHIADGDQIRFVREGFGDVVLDHLWREYPKARHSLLSWSHGAAEAIPWHQRFEVARRWYALAERQMNERPVIGVFAAWGGEPGLRAAVVPVMAEAAVHPDLGPKVRQYLYELAIRRGGSDMDTAVAQVCGQYGRAQPQTALTRLAWIADRAKDRGAEAVHGALRSISREVECRPVLVREMVDWATDDKGRGRAGIARSFLCALLAEKTEGGFPLLVNDMLRPRSEMTARLVGSAVAIALTTAKTAETVLGSWLPKPDSGRAEEVRAAVSRVLLQAGSLSTQANVRLVHWIGERYQYETDVLAPDFAQRILDSDPLLRPSSITLTGSRQ